MVIEPLGSRHDRSRFSCGQPALDDWFRRRTGQDEKRNVARVFVAFDDAIGVVGKLVWNRLRYVKDPSTGKRVSRLNHRRSG